MAEKRSFTLVVPCSEAPGRLLKKMKKNNDDAKFAYERFSCEETKVPMNL